MLLLPHTLQNPLKLPQGKIVQNLAMSNLKPPKPALADPKANPEEANPPPEN